MKSSFMKLNHVSTFSGKGQLEISYFDIDSRVVDFSSLVGRDGWGADLFFEKNIAIISGGGFTGIVGVGHDRDT